MDYTKQELRPLIYQDRSSIDEFDVADPESLDALMLEQIDNSMIVELDGAAQYILEIFNNAHYITTLILMEKHPVHYFRSYINIAERAGAVCYNTYEKNTYHRYFESVTMAMVWNYLCACWPDVYTQNKRNNLLQEKIWDYHHKNYYDTEWDGKARFLFFNNVLNDQDLQKCRVDKYKFIPLHSPEELKEMELKKEKRDEPITETATTADEEVMEEISAHDKVRLELLLKLMEKDGVNLTKHGNKAKAASILNTLTGLSLNTCKQYCSDRNLNVATHSEEILKINTLLQALEMESYL